MTIIPATTHVMAHTKYHPTWDVDADFDALRDCRAGCRPSAPTGPEPEPLQGNRAALVLAYIAANPGCTRAEIAGTLGLQPSAVAGALARLYRQGSLLREPELRFHGCTHYFGRDNANPHTA